MASLDSSVAAYGFKLLYADGLDEEALIRNKPLMQWVKNETDFTTSEGIKIPIPYVNSQGIGPTNAIAAANATPRKGKSFLVPQRHSTAFGQVDGDVVRNTINGGDPTQFTNMLQLEVDGCTESLGTEVQQRMYGDKTGIRSLTSATGAINTTTWFLANVEDAQFYEPDMKVVLVNPATGAARAGTAVTIVSVDPINGSFVASGNPNSFTGATAGDGIARDGFVGADLDGLKAWCPAVVSNGENFMGVDRSVYRTRLAGVYVDASQYAIRQGFIKALAVARAQVGSKFESSSPFFINPKNIAQIKQSVESTKIVKVQLEDKYSIGLDAIEVEGYTFVEDATAPVNEAYLIGTNALTRATCGKQPAIDDQDGSEFWYNRQTGKLEFCLAHDGNVASYEPYNLMRVILPNVPL